LEDIVSAVDVLGYAAAAAVLATFCMKTMIPLRIAALGSNVLFMAYGYVETLYPVLALHAILFAVNALRLAQSWRLVREMSDHHGEELPLRGLLPYMTQRKFIAGETLVRKGEKADRLYRLEEGELEVADIGKVLKPGAVIGEVGVFAPNQVRMATIVCRTDCTVSELTESTAKQLFLQHRAFGFAVLQLIISRLVENTERLMQTQERSYAEGSKVSWGLSSLLPRRRPDKGREAKAVEQRVSALQTALNHWRDVAGRRTQFRQGVTAAIVVLALALGFALGIYREPIQQFAGGLPRAMGLPGAARSGDPYAAFQEGDYETVLRLATPLAEAGDVRAQSTLGIVYYRGGGGVQRNYDAALKWFRLAADQGDATAELHIGLMYLDGAGVPRDDTEEAKWFQRAADRGEPAAQYNLGALYANGGLGQVDSVQAYMWFNIAASRLPSGDPRRLTAIEARDRLAEKMTQEQIAEAQKRSREWKPK
jgi:CRP-like cAMP-binding protein